MDRILVATDGSDGSRRALDFAIRLAVPSNAKLYIINVIGGYGLPPDLIRNLSGTESAWFDDALASHSAEILHAARERAAAAGLGSIVLESQRGAVAENVLDYARSQQIDAIVVGKRGQGRIEAFLLGSVSQKLVSLADIAVIVVP